MSALESLLSRQGFAVLDGAMGTELARLGADVNHPLWSGRVLRDAPELVQAVHASHLQAGADIVLAASYQIGDDPALLRRAVRVAQAARDQQGSPAIVVGSLGPYGAVLADGSEYSGDYGLSQGALEDFHRPRIGPLVEAGADLLAFETIPSLQEARAIVSLLEAERPAIGAWVSFACRDGETVVRGDAFAECVKAVAACDGVVAVGVNCTAPQHVASLLSIAGRVTDKPLVAYPNRGAIWDGVEKRWDAQRETHGFEHWARRYREAGACIIGGCCQTTPDDIRQVRQGLSSLQMERAPSKP